jgi:hypothetical protein
LFLVETDTKLPNGKSDYKIEGYATVLQKTNQFIDKIRIIGLVEEDTFKYTKIREDLISTQCPSIWLEIIRTTKICLCVGFIENGPKMMTAQKPVNHKG